MNIRKMMIIASLFSVSAALPAFSAISEHDTSTPLKEFRPKMLPPITAAEQAALRRVIGRCKCTVEINGDLYGDESDCVIAGTRGTNSVVNGVAHLLWGA